jgi:5'-nucleotidase
VPVIQSKSYADAFGVIELTYDANEKQLDRSATTIWKPTPLCRQVFADTKNCKEGSGPLTEPVFLGEKIVPDEATAQAMRSDVEKIAVLKSEKIGPILREPFTRNRSGESTLGDLVTDVMRAQFANADVAIFNSGGLRADLNAGPLTYGRVFSALPFDNRFAVLKLTGVELLGMLSTAFSGEHGVLQLSGLSVEAVEPGAATCTPGASRVLSVKLADGKPLNPTAMYTVVTNDFVAGGGDGYNAVLKNVDPMNNVVRHDLPPLREVVVTYFRQHPQITGPEGLQGGRIRYSKPSCAKAAGALR